MSQEFLDSSPSRSRWILIKGKYEKNSSLRRLRDITPKWANWRWTTTIIVRNFIKLLIRTLKGPIRGTMVIRKNSATNIYIPKTLPKTVFRNIFKHLQKLSEAFPNIYRTIAKISKHSEERCPNISTSVPSILTFQNCLISVSVCLCLCLCLYFTTKTIIHIKL